MQKSISEVSIVGWYCFILQAWESCANAPTHHILISSYKTIMSERVRHESLDPQVLGVEGDFTWGTHSFPCLQYETIQDSKILSGGANPGLLKEQMGNLWPSVYWTAALKVPGC